MDTGVLVDWNDERGFGFIEQQGERTFVHVSAFDPGGGRPRAGDLVRFEAGLAEDGRRRAVRAARAGASRAVARGSGPTVQAAPLVAAAGLLGLLAVATWAGWLAAWLAAVYVVMSLFTALLYALDKRRAMAGAWRVPELNLQLAALLGGWPGAVLAQQLLRHKNRKRSFQSAFWVAVAANLVLFGLLSHPEWLAPVSELLP